MTDEIIDEIINNHIGHATDLIGKRRIVEAIKTAIAHEREACAKVADSFTSLDDYTLADHIAAAIRKRGQQ